MEEGAERRRSGAGPSSAAAAPSPRTDTDLLLASRPRRGRPSPARCTQTEPATEPSRSEAISGRCWSRGGKDADEDAGGGLLGLRSSSSGSPLFG